MDATEVFCKDFKDISYENASFRMLEDSTWPQVIYFVTTIASFWFVNFLLPIDGDTIN